MSAKYNIQFSQEDYQKFELAEDFGVPIKNLRQLLTLDVSQRVQPGVQTGIPVDSTENTTNELYHWVQSARLATAEITKEKESEKDFVDPGPMKIAIKADANEKYPSINLVIETLRNQKQNKFSFVTGLKGNE